MALPFRVRRRPSCCCKLRDPAIFEEGGRVVLLYAAAGESGIALAALEGT